MAIASASDYVKFCLSQGAKWNTEKMRTQKESKTIFFLETIGLKNGSSSQPEQTTFSHFSMALLSWI